MAARASSLRSLCTTFAVAAAMLAPAVVTAQSTEAAATDDAPPAGAVGFLVVRENGSGSASAAKGLINDLVQSIAREVGWPGAFSKYTTKRKTAEKFIREDKPSFGFLSFGTYLGLRKAHGLRALAQIETNANGSAQYFVVSKNQFTLDGCKGAALASNHVGDEAFIDNVVSGGAFKLADFTVNAVKRPGQTVKAVIDDEAACALVDEAQVVAMTKMEGGADLRPVWSSKPLPAFVLVAFESATKDQISSFSKKFDSICDSEEGKAVCSASGITEPKPIKSDFFAADEAAYGE